ncbi:hypothetical protein PR048_022027 [Dryococelus australis]|uniref:UNC93-like protein n=1 Tax=Dryococelus australis TaxID=614101 RepID=A0ABQ9GZY4_9NEOP|nr:hypothetical protein PR048_022027 [Dryococelus australis]
MNQHRNERVGDTGDPVKTRRPVASPGIEHGSPRRSGLNPRPGHSGFSHVGIVPDDVVGRRVFSGISILTSITLIGSQDIEFKNRPDFFTHSKVFMRNYYTTLIIVDCNAADEKSRLTKFVGGVGWFSEKVIWQEGTCELLLFAILTLAVADGDMVTACDDRPVARNRDDKKHPNKQKDDDSEGDVVTVSVSGGYANEAFKDDGDMNGTGAIAKPPLGGAGDEANVPDDGKCRLSRREKWRILKNVAAVSLAFMVQFTAFQGIANLQSSINASEGLGTVSLSAIYAALVLSCMFVPTFLIKRLTVKWTLCLSMLCYVPYIASQFYPKFYTLVPAGVLLGLGAAPMWASKATYLTQVGGVYAKLTDQAVDGIVVRFFGFFFLAWQTAELWGNLISSLVTIKQRHIKEYRSLLFPTSFPAYFVRSSRSPGTTAARAFVGLSNPRIAVSLESGGPHSSPQLLACNSRLCPLPTEPVLDRHVEVTSCRRRSAF